MDRLQRRASILRIADEFEKKLLQEISRTIPPNVYMKLRRAFTQRGMPFFDFYSDLRRRYIGVEDPEATPINNLFAHYRSLVRQLARVKSPVDGKRLSPAVLNNLLESADSLRMFFSRVERNPRDKMAWKGISNAYGPIIIAVARDKGIYLSSRPKGPVRWMEFHPMKAEDVAEEKLKDYDPETYQAIKQNKKDLASIEQDIYSTMEQAGFVPEKTVLSGIDFNAFLDSSTVTKLNFLRKEWKDQKLYVATEPVTGEQVVFDLQGRVFDLDEWVDQEYERVKSIRKSTRTNADPDKLRSLSDEQVDSLDTEINYTSLTDNTANAYKLTKIFATKKDDTGRSVIVSGRYKGIYLDDIVNDQGRLIEGTEWGFNSRAYQDKEGKWRGKPERIDPSDREPYVTVGEDGRFYMVIPGTHDFSLYRNMLYSSYPKSTRRKKGLPETTLSEEIPPPGLEVIKQQGSRKLGIAFTPENFGAIKETMGSMALSGAAFDKLTAYFKELSEAEQATAEENLGFYTTEKLGGFKDFVKLSTNQKKALAWLDANGDKGVVALDTGVGKSALSIAAMQKFLRDGYAEPDAGTNGRFLFVCPTNLKGNVDAEIEKFLDGEPAASLRGRIDQMDYNEFARARAKGMWKRREAVTLLDSKGRTKTKKDWVTTDPWSADNYIAVFFDEAQAMRVPGRSTSKAAMSLNHPRKICLTASPLEKEPMDAYTLAAICNNLDLSEKGANGRENRKKAKLFKQRYCEVIGGRIMGVKKDPLIQRELNTWVKRNIFYADKTDKGSFRTESFPKLVSRSQPIIMAPEIEDAYRETAGEIQDVMKSLVVKFRDKGYLQTENGKLKKYIPAEDKEIEKWVGGRMRPLFKKLHELANHPDDVIPGLPNPKIEMSREIVASKLENDVSERTVLFSDDAKLVEKTALQLSKTLPGIHVAGLSTKIKFFEAGSEMSEYTLKVPSSLFTKREQSNIDNLEAEGEAVRNQQPIVKHSLPFRKNLYRKYPGRPVSGENPETTKLHEWSVFVLRNIVSADPQMKTVTLLGTKYDTGQNLQAFSNVIHLDRDTWNSESMKQRTARCWRQGQQNAVEETMLDTRYSVVKDKFDMTLDEIRKYHQMLEGDLFDEIIKQSQTTELGKEWLEIEAKVSEFKKVDKQALELFMSPYLDTSSPRHNSPAVQDL